MKPHSCLAVMCLAVASCGPVSMYYKPGAPVSRMQTDTTECEVQALKDAPVANQVRQRPPIYFPGNRVCDGSGYCWTTPGYWVDGGFYTVDVNRDLRSRVLDICMSKRGYQPVSLPNCSSGVKSAAPPRQTTKLPQLTENSCIIRYDDGSWQIVN